MQYDYSLRGKCKEYAEKLISDDPSLRLVRGYYHCPFEGAQQHWWCETARGDIVDPTAAQFSSVGTGEYEEFDGKLNCENCGKEGTEQMVLDGEWMAAGNYPVCSGKCYGELVGVC